MGKIKSCTPFFVTLCVILIFYFKRVVFLKFYPPLCNFTFFMIFFISVFTKEPIILKFAKMYGDNPKGSALNYIRNLTYVWTIFLFINFLISIWTIYLPDKIWILYNGFISYFLIGLLFILEYILRKILQSRKII